MDINKILEQVDAFYEKNQGKEAEKLLRESVAKAAEERDDAGLLQLLNELLGYYRETGQKEASFQIGEQATALAVRMGLENSIPYATTLLNLANAYRAGGALDKSLDCYQQVQAVYDKLLSEDNILMAGLYNNMSLLYQEKSDFAMAMEMLLKALAIVEKKDAEFEVAVTCANLAGTCMQLGKKEEAKAYAERSIRHFEKMGVEDAHYSAALSALGAYYYEKGEYRPARDAFEKAMGIVEASLGQNEHYRRLKENIQACEASLGQESNAAESEAHAAEEKVHARQSQRGLSLSREFYEKYGRPMLESRFPDYLDKIAVGLAGEGSDCFGYDDVYSRDHDWGPDFCLWVTDETWEEIGEALSRAYETLPKEAFLAEKTGNAEAGKDTTQARGRRGVMKISGFYKKLLSAETYEEIEWRNVPDFCLAAAVNGEVFRDEEGIFSAFRAKLMQGYPAQIRFLKLAESAARFAQAAQYNYGRMKKRGDEVTASVMLADGIREAMKLQHYIEGKFPPHDKWLYRSTGESAGGKVLCELLAKLTETIAQSKEATDGFFPGNAQKAESGSNAAGILPEQIIEQIADFLAHELYENNFTSDTDSYLDAHTQELIFKASFAGKENAELAEAIAKLEFQAFDKVHNKGGRASCQNDWATFSIMRKSQYLTWNRPMLLQYLYDFQRELDRGHNLIEEKYGRMMESTAPEEYAQIKAHFPVLSLEKKQIIEQIVGLQVGWMEEFTEKYPHLGDNARSVHTYDDNLYNTSYETYLRGELGTYSDKMLEMYGRYVVEYAREGKNLAFVIMTNSVTLYGYKSLEAAEAFLKL